MERVQFQQEQMLSELKDLAQKGIFTQAELKQIMKKRTAFETTLVRRVPRKGDFLRYAAYEMSLEALRRKRVERLKLPKGPPSVSDYALVRRQFQIFERALKKFKEDVGLWVQYLQVAKREGARALVGRISARALQLHPNSPSLYILAASHELDHLSHSAARVLLQRGIRLNPESIDLWREYLKMELGFVESLRRRWEVLGLDANAPDSPPEQPNDNTDDPMDTTTPDVDDSEKARKEVLQGALAKAVMTSAVKAKPIPELFSALHSVLVSYPCPPDLRRSLLEHLRSHLQTSLSLDTDSVAAKLCATWHLTSDLSGLELVDAIKGANDELSQRLRHAEDSNKGKHKAKSAVLDMAKAYSEFIREWFGKDIDENLKLYLLTSLRGLCVHCKAEPLLLTHLQLLSSPQNPNPLPKAQLLKLTKKYSSKVSTSHELWLFRLDLESSENGEDWSSSAKEARQRVPPNSEDDSARCAIWEWVLDRKPSKPPHEIMQLTESLLHEACAAPRSEHITDRLLVRYIRSLREHSEHLKAKGEHHNGDQIKDIGRLSKSFLVRPKVWEAAFDIYSETSPSSSYSPPTASTIKSTDNFPMDVDTDDETPEILRAIYNKWRLASLSAHGEAALKWGRWLSSHERGTEATEVIATARTAITSLGGSVLEDFEKRWRDILDNDGEDEERDSDDEGEPLSTA
ncbi:hypothetical protein SCHPADRAFT_937468 [Schizopora paradoxa]|uniref:U3 small nucleolar RNA-associated protein 6 N-terminal domain-containing protein n=1 Tax=Schizopora paradoxa TaxID=27342 RepID=A0A0H2S5N1_9AGAM|nr:hypothetical protein SCHPADRAFT_937468 [Schizopora paradoxa]